MVPKTLHNETTKAPALCNFCALIRGIHVVFFMQ